VEIAPILYGFVTALKGPLMDRVLSFCGKARGEYSEAFAEFGSSVFFLHTAPTERGTRKSVNSRWHMCPFIIDDPI
jgi:hypothetical protein